MEHTRKQPLSPIHYVKAGEAFVVHSFHVKIEDHDYVVTAVGHSIHSKKRLVRRFLISSKVMTAIKASRWFFDQWTVVVGNDGVFINGTHFNRCMYDCRE